MIALGGSNTEFYFISSQVRRVRNKITCFKGTNGATIEELSQIREVYEEYYKQI